jgi:carbon-monoxide dehydrogenase large subunit
MFVRRSDVARARLLRVDVTAAQEKSGVIAAFTAHDLPPSARYVLDSLLPPQLAGIARPVLAEDEVKHVGEALAVVVAETAYAAQDAASAIDVDIQPLPACGTVESALAPGAPLVHNHLGSNVGVWGIDGFGDAEGAFAGAITVSERLTMARVVGAAIEPRTVTAAPEGGGVSLWTSTQAVFRVRDMVASALGLEASEVVVRAKDVGGGFGPKGRRYPEDVLVAWAARQLDRPIMWVATRTEETASSMHGHGSTFELEVAADPDGRLRGLRGVLWHDIGAYPSIGALLPGSILRNMLCTYRLPALRFEVRGVLTNTAPTGTVRGGPGPEGNFAIERMLDLLAARLGLAPAELRRRNLLEPTSLPYVVRLAASEIEVDGADFPRLLEEAERHAAAPPDDQDGRLHGVGLVMGVELGANLFPSEPARIRLHNDGTAHVFIGSSPQGQSHETMATQIVADRLGWPADRIRVHSGDTTSLPRAGPTATSRSAICVGNAVAMAAGSVRGLLVKAAANVLGIDWSQLELEGGWIVETKAARRLRPALDFLALSGIDVTEVWRAGPHGGCSASSHAVEVAVDPDTGAVEVLRYVVAYDAGVLVNPSVVDGQLTGGIAHGIGYSVLEEAQYASDGEMLTPTFREYVIAGPADIAFEPVLVSCPTAATSNPGGFKGAGEIGVIAAPAAIAAAIESAVRKVAPHARITEIPVRPETIVSLLASSPAVY